MTLENLFQKYQIRSNFESLTELTNSWNEIIEDCGDGYNQNIFELDYDIAVRDEIQLLLEDTSFKDHNDYKNFKNKIELLDERFLGLVNFITEDDINHFFWKRKFVLIDAGIEYRNSVFKEFGIKY
ncbi:hypothetical protein [Aquimarina macrocephali]|uniref:hypothetical protein n=1 Tax=Aquimarina macrocephali TaxID=666563 RepID=UPI003F662F25